MRGIVWAASSKAAIIKSVILGDRNLARFDAYPSAGRGEGTGLSVDRFPGRGRRKLDTVIRLLPALAGLILAGCALGGDPSPLTESDAANVPNVAALAPAIQDTFKAVKFTGYPRVSMVSKAPVSALGDWRICLMSDSESDRRVYALLIQNNAIADYRLALPVDGCAKEMFAPLPSSLVTK